MKLTTKKVHIIEIILGIIFVSLGIFHTNIWFDEAYSVALAKHTFVDIWTIGGNDVHPILYYWLLHIIEMFTNGSIIAYRIFSVVPIIILGILGFTHIRKDFGEKTGVIFSFLVYFMPVSAIYANQIRMYSWAILSVTILAIYAYRIFKGQDANKNIIIFGFAILFSIYTHYYGLMVAGIINVALLIYLFIKKNNKTAIKILVLGIVQLIAYIPWMINFITQLSNVSKGFWVGFEYPKTLVELSSFEFLGNSINQGFGMYQYVIFTLAIEVYIYLGIKIYKMYKQKEDVKAPILATIIYIAVIIASLIITLIMKTSILYYRYLFVITGIYIFVISFVLAKEKNKIITFSICTAILITSLISNITNINENYDLSNKEPINYLKENISQDDTIVYSEIGIGAIYAVFFENNKQYFYNSEHWGVEEAYKAFSPQMKTCEDDEFLKECGKRIWLVGYGDNVYNLLFNNESYEKISKKRIDTKYQNNSYNIILVEKK